MITLNGFQNLKARGYYTKTPNYASFFVQLISTYKKCGHFPECFPAENTTKNDRTLIYMKSTVCYLTLQYVLLRQSKRQHNP